MMVDINGFENSADFLNYISSYGRKIVEEFHEARSDNWQIQVIIVECLICFVLLFLIWAAWGVYGETIQVLLTQSSNSSTPIKSKRFSENKSPTISKKPL